MIQVISSMYDYMYIYYFLPPTQEATDSVSGSYNTSEPHKGCYKRKVEGRQGRKGRWRERNKGDGVKARDEGIRKQQSSYSIRD